MSTKANGQPVCLFGDVVQDDGSVLHGQYVLIVGGRIQSVSGEKSDSIKKPDYSLADDELLFPSFLDLHTHSSYNMLPLWHSPFWAWDNRFQWRGNATYKQTVGGLNRSISAAYGHGTRIYEAFNAFSELMAIAGGTTVLQENAHLECGGYPRDTHVLIRSTGSPADMGLKPNENVVSVADFYEPDPYTAPRNPYQDTSGWGVKQVGKGMFDGATYLADFAVSVSGTRTRGTIVHLAEGRSGFLQTAQGPDPYTRAEFEEFKNFITYNYSSPGDVEKVKQAHLLLIHGCGMNTVSDVGLKDLATNWPKTRKPSTIKETIAFLQKYGIGIIWSPVSNLLLYQDTTNVLPLLDAGVPVVLGTDWTPSGSKTVWEEAKFAADFLEAQDWKGNVSKTCFQSITSAAADCLGVPLGRIKPGNFADVVIIRRPTGAKRGDALGTFRKATDQDVRGVFLEGVPLYGDPDVLKAFGLKPSPLPEEHSIARGDEPAVATSKSICLPDECEITMDELTAAIKTADRVVGRNRPKFLVADDADYQARMSELRDWVQKFDPKKSPNPIPPAPAPSDLAPSEAEWMYNPSLDPKNRMDEDVVELLGRCAPCRDKDCAVPKRHPFYHAEVLTEAGDSYGFRSPCMPVVPVLTNKKQLFVMGDYPTAKFTARSTNNLPVITGKLSDIDEANEELAKLLHDAAQQPHSDNHLLQTYIEEINDVIREAYARPDIDNVLQGRRHTFGNKDELPPRRNQFFVPVGDVFAPMQDANYFDGYKVRNVAAGVFFQEYYLRAVGVNINTQVWLTNMIKCFLFHQSMADSYQALGWTDVRVEQSYSELLPVSKVCSQWINEEVVVCDPQLVLTVGKPPCTLLHNVPFGDIGMQGRIYNTLLGHLLEAGDSKVETAIAKNLNLTSTYDPPFAGTTPAAKARSAKSAAAKSSFTKKESHPVTITRIAPWSNYNVFHMLHPQAVMMSQTGVVTGLLSAIQAVLGPKSNGMSMSDLQGQIGAYLKKNRTSDLINTLPYGLRDQFYTNARMLELHAVTLANLADVLNVLKLVHGVNGDTVLKQQASELAETYHLADSAADELSRLKQLRSDNSDRFDKLSK